MSSGSIFDIRASPGPEQLSTQPARARKDLYDQSPGLPEPDTESSMCMQYALHNNNKKKNQKFLISSPLFNCKYFYKNLLCLYFCIDMYV